MLNFGAQTQVLLVQVVKSALEQQTATDEQICTLHCKAAQIHLLQSIEKVTWLGLYYCHNYFVCFVKKLWSIS